MQDEQVIAATRRWIERFVVGMNLCPFARRELDQGRVRFAVSAAKDEQQLLRVLQEELERMSVDDAIDTTLLIHPDALQDFYAYNDFLGDCEELLATLDFEGIFQIASFHPQYRFAGTDPEDAENFSNRSPWPMLHILRESSVARAVASHPDAEGIPARNIGRLNAEGVERLRSQWQDCFDD